MKTNQRLGYQRLADELIERDLIDRAAVLGILQQGEGGGSPFPVALIEADLVTDWELSRIVCELYSLPFLTVEVASPSRDLLERLDPFFLAEHQLVPLCLHGRVLTVLMPAIVQAEVLAKLAADTGLAIMPAVGTVQTNRNWITEHLAELTSAPVELDPQWSNIFDEADAAVLSDLGAPTADETEGLTSIELTDEDGEAPPSLFEGGIDGQAA